MHFRPLQLVQVDSFLGQLLRRKDRLVLVGLLELLGLGAHLKNLLGVDRLNDWH
ncbi:MAG: hypothetical protein ACE5GQ_02705 [Nitrospinales bacterium]